MVVFNGCESAPLEGFLLDVCQRSLHASIVGLWFLESYLVELRALSVKEGGLPADRCARLLQEVQTAVWGDQIKPVPVRRLSREYVAAEEADGGDEAGLDTLPNVEGTLVGFGCILGALASPALSQALRPLVMMEARRRDHFRQQAPRLKTARHPAYAQHRPVMVATFPSIEDLSQGKAFSFQGHLKDMVKRIGHQRAPTASAPTLSYHPEMQFVMGLIDVSRRLCLVSAAKEGRQQALMAELSLLNHNLPAAMCIPLWCCGYDPQCPGPAAEPEAPHHRILRIPPSEAVILNSAERVPFVMYVEVLRDTGDAAFGALVARPASPCGSHGSARRHTEPLEGQCVVRTPHARSKSIQSTPLEPTGSPLAEAVSPPGSARLPAMGSGPLFPLNQPVSSDDFAERMRTAAIMLAQLSRQATQPGVAAGRLADIAAIKAKLIGEMEALEKSRLLDALQTTNPAAAFADLESAMLPMDTRAVPVKDDPSAAVFSEAWDDKRARIRDASPYGQLPGWDLLSVIVKSGSDMRQEQLACQLIELMHDIWAMAALPIWVYPFRILVAAAEGGLVETVRNAVSIHSIKKKAYTVRAAGAAAGDALPPFTLRDHYIRQFGSPDSDAFINARDAFVKSLAGYSLVSYVLQLRDRHNGNILVDAAGHLIHIDFGFMLANAPGGYYGFESAPFKLSAEYIDLMGGLQGEPFAAFKDLMLAGFMALRKHADRILLLLEISQKASRLPCFGSSGLNTVAQMRQRFQLGLPETQVRLFVDRMITGSAYNVFTRLYDSFQYYSNGIL